MPWPRRWHGLFLAVKLGDTVYVGTLKGVGRVYQQTYIGTIWG